MITFQEFFDPRTIALHENERLCNVVSGIFGGVVNFRLAVYIQLSAYCYTDEYTVTRAGHEKILKSIGNQ